MEKTKWMPLTHIQYFLHIMMRFLKNAIKWRQSQKVLTIISLTQSPSLMLTCRRCRWSSVFFSSSTSVFLLCSSVISCWSSLMSSSALLSTAFCFSFISAFTSVCLSLMVWIRDVKRRSLSFTSISPLTWMEKKRWSYVLHLLLCDHLGLFDGLFLKSFPTFPAQLHHDIKTTDCLVVLQGPLGPWIFICMFL